MIHSSLGTVVQETSNFLVEEKIIASPTTSVTFSDLDGIKDAGYVLEIAGINNSAASAQWFCYVNGDTTLANYHSTWIGQSSNTGGTATYALAAEPYRVYGVGVGTRVFSKADILFCPGSGLTTFFSMTRSFYPTSTTNTGWSGYHEHRVAQANITSLTITSDVANAIGAGTILRLYRKKQGIPSAFPSAQGLLVADIIVPTATTDVVISNLDLDLHGGYDIECSFVAAAGSNAVLYCYPNQNTSSANYRRRYVYGTGTSTVAGGGDTNPSITQFTNGHHTRFKLEFYPRNVSTNMVYYFQSLYFSAASEMYTMTGHILNFDNFGNITSLLFRSSVASGIGAGTRIQVYRKK